MAALTPSQPRSIPAVTLAHAALLAPITQRQSVTFSNNDRSATITIISKTPSHRDSNQAKIIGNQSQRPHPQSKYMEHPQSPAPTAAHLQSPSKSRKARQNTCPRWQPPTSNITIAHLATAVHSMLAHVADISTFQTTRPMPRH